MVATKVGSAPLVLYERTHHLKSSLFTHAAHTSGILSLLCPSSLAELYNPASMLSAAVTACFGVLAACCQFELSYLFQFLSQGGSSQNHIQARHRGQHSPLPFRRQLPFGHCDHCYSGGIGSQLPFVTHVLDAWQYSPTTVGSSIALAG